MSMALRANIVCSLLAFSCNEEKYYFSQIYEVGINVIFVQHKETAENYLLHV